MPRKIPLQEKALEPITEKQQSFIEALLTGKNISEAALIAGISRRTATYWLADPEHPVCVEYEKQRITARQEFYSRVASLYEKALKAMEDALSEAAPPAIRFQAAKFLYEKHLEQLCGVRAPDRAQQLVEIESNLVQEREYFQTYNAYRINQIPD
jgi:phage terminase small subunit